MNRWWRWGVRALAVFAFVGAGLLLTLHPSASYAWPGTAGLTTNRCFSPYDRLSPKSDTAEVFVIMPSWQYSPANRRPWQLVPGIVTAVSACNSATNGREHDVEALAAAGLVLVALSFTPQRRRVSAASRQQLAPSQS
jgi:hypothetical protein